MFKKIAAWCAKFALGYLPDVAVGALKLGTEKTKGSAKAASVLEAVEKIAADANAIAAVMKDGKISAEEETAVRLRAAALAEDLKALL